LVSGPIAAIVTGSWAARRTSTAVARGAARIGRRDRGGQHLGPPAQPVVAVPAPGEFALRVHQRPVRPRRDRDVPAPAQRQDPTGVGGGVRHGHVPEHRADGQQVHLGATPAPAGWPRRRPRRGRCR
jgi:hypothetical protein